MLLDFGASWRPGCGSGHVGGRPLSTVGGAMAPQARLWGQWNYSRTTVRQLCASVSSLGRMRHPLGCLDGQSRRWPLYWNTAGMDSAGQDPCAVWYTPLPLCAPVRFPQLSPDRPAATLSKTRPGLACGGACVSSGLRFPTGEVRASWGESQGGGASRGQAVLSGALASLRRKAVRSVSSVCGAGAGLPLHCVLESLSDSGQLWGLLLVKRGDQRQPTGPSWGRHLSENIYVHPLSKADSPPWCLQASSNQASGVNPEGPPKGRNSSSRL